MLLWFDSDVALSGFSAFTACSFPLSSCSSRSSVSNTRKGFFLFSSVFSDPQKFMQYFLYLARFWGRALLYILSGIILVVIGGGSLICCATLVQEKFLRALFFSLELILFEFLLLFGIWMDFARKFLTFRCLNLELILFVCLSFLFDLFECSFCSLVLLLSFHSFHSLDLLKCSFCSFFCSKIHFTILIC
jgi:hypothetical protein